MRPATLTPPKAGALLPPSNFPKNPAETCGFGDAERPRRVSLPFAAPTHAPTPAHEAAKHPAAAHPGGRGVTCPHRAAGAPPSPAVRDGAADPLPGRAVVPSNRPAGGGSPPAGRGGSPPAGRGGAACLHPGRAADRPLLYAPAGALDLPAALRWSIPPREVAALAATITFATAATLWFAVLIGRL